MNHSVADLCKLYGVTEGTVLVWIRSGELRALNVGRRAGSKKPRWRVTPVALAAFELARTAEPTAPKSNRRPKRVDVIEFYK